MLPFKTLRSIQMSGVISAAVFALACGGDSSEPSGTTPAGDAGTGQTAFDASNGGANGSGAGQCLTTQFGTGVQCTTSTGQTGYRLCQNNVPVGDCMSFLGDGGIGALLDSGVLGAIADSGLVGQFLGEAGVTFGDGSIMYGDASISLEAGTLKCPTGYECSNIGGAIGLPLSGCAMPGQLFPPTCTPGSACKVGSSSGTCQNIILDNYCIVPCN